MGVRPALTGVGHEAASLGIKTSPVLLWDGTVAETKLGCKRDAAPFSTIPWQTRRGNAITSFRPAQRCAPQPDRLLGLGHARPCRSQPHPRPTAPLHRPEA